MPNWICRLCDNDTPIPHDECEEGPFTERPHKPVEYGCCILVRLGQKRHAKQCQWHPDNKHERYPASETED